MLPGVIQTTFIQPPVFLGPVEVLETRRRACQCTLHKEQASPPEADPGNRTVWTRVLGSNPEALPRGQARSASKKLEESIGRIAFGRHLKRSHAGRKYLPRGEVLRKPK